MCVGQVRSCLVFEKTAAPLAGAGMVVGRDVVWQEAVRQQPNECAPEWVDAEDPLFLL